MIVEYHRPKTIQAAIRLLAREQPPTFPLAGGTVINRPSPAPIAVVDLQDLDLRAIHRRGHHLDIGATATLQALLERTDTPKALAKAIRHEATYTLRHMKTVAGSLVAADGRSPFATTILAMDAQIRMAMIVSIDHKMASETLSLGEIYPLRAERLKGRLITEISIPLNVKLAYEYVARAPADQPIICAAVARWSSGRTRIVLGGYGDAPILAFDGPESIGGEIAAASAYSQAGDLWASAEYRQEMARILSLRCLSQVEEDENSPMIA